MPRSVADLPVWAGGQTFDECNDECELFTSDPSWTTPSLETVWRDIRALRHQPPGRAKKGDRRRVFGAALEQSAQLFSAATAVDYTSRPILLFYGLSQAGRAIAAASTTADNDRYRLSGHGIEVFDLGQRLPLHRLRLSDKGTGSFTQLASLLSSGSLPQGALLGEVWATLPDLRNNPLDTESIEYNSALRCHEEWRNDARWILSVQFIGGGVTDFQEIKNRLAPYPLIHSLLPVCDIDCVAAYNFHLFPHGQYSPGVHKADARHRGLYVEWARMSFDAHKGRPTRQYVGLDDRWLFPSVGEAALPLHPLLSWWALLYTLSMLARYEPASWVSHLDVDTSPNAVALETALDQALNVCPRLILRSIYYVSMQSDERRF